MNSHNLYEMSDADLLEEYAYAVARNHYDPCYSRVPLFDEDTLQEEVLRRMGRRLTAE